MSEQTYGAVEETYTARLHLIGFDENTDAVSYRYLQVPGLDQPHIEAVQAASITDIAEQAVYSSTVEVPNLFAIDFPAMAHPGKVTPSWLSHEKRSLYEQAISLQERREATIILGDWIDAHLRSTHVVTSDQGKMVSVSKLEHQPFGAETWEYIGKRLSAFTIGPGRKYRTPALSALIAVASKEGVIPETRTQPRAPVHLGTIAVLQLLVANERLPISPAYVTSNYTSTGVFMQPEARDWLPPITASEITALRESGLDVAESTSAMPLDDKLFRALLRHRILHAEPNLLDLVAPYPINEQRTITEIASMDES